MCVAQRDCELYCDTAVYFVTLTSMMSEFSIGSSAMGKRMGEDKEFLGARPRSGIHRFHALSVVRAQSQDPSKCKGGWEIQPTHEPRSKRNGIIFVTGPHPCLSTGKLSEGQCWVLGKYPKDVFYSVTTIWLFLGLQQYLGWLAQFLQTSLNCLFQLNDIIF